MKGLNYYGKLMSGYWCENCPTFKKLGGNVDGCYQPCHICNERMQLNSFMSEMHLTFDDFMTLMEYLEVEDSIMVEEEDYKMELEAYLDSEADYDRVMQEELNWYIQARQMGWE